MLRHPYSIFAILGFGMLFLPTLNAQTEEPGSVFETLDAPLKGDFKIRISVTQPSNPFLAGQGTVTRHGVLAKKGVQKCLSLESAAYSQPPVFKQATAPGYKAIDYDGDGNLIVWRERGLHVVASHDVTEVVTERFMTAIKEDGSLVHTTEPGRNGNPPNRCTIRISRHDPSDGNGIVRIQELLLCANYGMSAWMDTVISEASDTSGNRIVQGTGTLWGGLAGSWDVRIARDEQRGVWMLRRAAFTVRGSEAPLYVFTTVGSLAYGDLILPERGTMSRRPGQPDEYRMEVQFLSGGVLVGEGVINEIKMKIAERKRNDAILMDYRANRAEPVVGRIEGASLER